MQISTNVIEVIIVSVTMCFGLTVIAEKTEDLARGWNPNIKWVTLKQAEKLSRTQNQPIMLLIHKSWCSACQALKPKFAESKDIEELSRNFVMVNTLDDEEPEDAKYAPDGGYIPRVLFIDQRGTVLPDIYNRNGNDKYRYYYHNPQHIAQSMRQCLEVTQHSMPESDEL